MQKKCSRCKHEKDLNQFVKGGRELSTCARCRELGAKNAKEHYAERYPAKYKGHQARRQRLLSEPVADGLKRCNKCLKPFPLDDFVVDGDERKSCSTCRARSREEKNRWVASWSTERKQTYEAKRKQNRILRKKVVIDGYGGKCACCGESHIEFLTIDHPERNGYHDRKVNGNWSSTLYRKLIKQGFPPTFRCLCFNCNWSMGIYGYCPHEKDRQKLPTSGTHEETESTIHIRHHSGCSKES